MSWIASMEIQSDGTWFTISVSRSSRKEAWEWLRSRMIWCFDQHLKYRKTKVYREPVQRYDPGQYEFLQGNEVCAREWQDSPLVRRDQQT